MGILSRPDILNLFKKNIIVIDPFEIKNLGNTSYDVRLGKYFYRQAGIKHSQILNPFSRRSMDRLYKKLEEAIKVRSIKSKINPFYGLRSSDLVILVAPGETILAHTIEFIGGKNGIEGLPAVTTEMRARSSIGRIGIAVCKCAGWGDIGYINRWTMEITNFSSAIIPLPVGLRVAQIIFHSTTPIERKDEYQKYGKYQKDLNIKDLKENWKPEVMLPKLYEDEDLEDFNKYIDIK